MTESTSSRRRTRRVFVAFLAGAFLIVSGFVIADQFTGTDAPLNPVEPSLTVPVRDVDQPRIANGTTLSAGEKTDRAGGHLVIDAAGIDAPVDETTVQPTDGGSEVVIPADASRTAWLNTAAHPGDVVGSSVITGHVSDTSDRPGALSRLGDVKVGDLVKWFADGRVRTFVVTGTATFPRSGSLPADIFDGSGGRSLHIITCTGRKSFPGGGFTYTDNLVVKAELYGQAKAIPVT